jgi:hypothetical protein
MTAEPTSRWQRGGQRQRRRWASRRKPSGGHQEGTRPLLCGSARGGPLGRGNTTSNV